MKKEKLLQGDDSTWNSYVRKNFIIANRGGFLIEPKRAAKGRPWLWRPEFFEAFNTADLALLNKGWHIAFYKFSQMFGSPEAIDLMKDYQKAVVNVYDLAPKTSVFGISRGGLYAFNYAAAYPEFVSSLYLDAPVLDMKSWPGGFGTGPGSPDDWRQCLDAYGMTEEEAKNYHDGPLDKIDRVAASGIPIILVAGDSDEIVPYEENGAVLYEKYKQAGGNIELVLKPGVGHHPHSLENPKPIVDFVTAAFERK